VTSQQERPATPHVIADDSAPSPQAFLSGPTGKQRTRAPQAPKQAPRQQSETRKSSASKRETSRGPVLLAMVAILFAISLYWATSPVIPVVLGVLLATSFLVWYYGKRDYSNRPIPKQGWPAGLYLANRAVFSLARTFTGNRQLKTPIPKLSKAEQAEQDEEQARMQAASLEKDEFRRLREEFEALGQEANRLVRVEKVELGLVVANEDGGVGKTFASNAFASELADMTRRSVVLIESRRGTAMGLATLGIPVEDTVTIRRLWGMMDEIADAKTFERVTSSNKYGVIGIAADMVIPEGDNFNGDNAGEVVELCGHMSRLVVMDTGNTPTDQINIGMCKYGNVGLFVARPANISTQICHSTMNTFRKHGLAHLVDNGLLVVNNLPEGQNAEDWRKNLDPGGTMPLYSIPSDTYVAPENVIDIAKWNFMTRLAIRRIIVAALKKAQEVQKAQTNQERNPS
jgi:MinD-like ATPase involved in chromosome partitioning or flagellar assembly